MTATFRGLHHGDAPLLLPNAWDVASALAFADAGFPAVGTTSFGVAATAGRPDAGRATREANLRLAHELSRLPIHVSVDIEDGYDDDPGRVAEFVADLGVAGVNIEDSSAERLITPGTHAAKVAAIKRQVPDVFVNARVDTYWLGQDADVAATLARAHAYVDAGADGVFIPGVTEPDEISALTTDITVPVNVLVVPGLSIDELRALGVRRVSTGSLPYRAAITAAVRVATAARDGDPLPAATSYPEMQAQLVHYASGIGAE
ncbi:MAG: isocitrate lyase/phosphoenolpyruvate mutase family protein [Pseudonocardia sp.]|nr:isocitrate lyase/phosphoenolpyruvate mutase family protein [Pseudonocardia sp.]